MTLPDDESQSPLARLADRLGIVADYLDQSGTERRVTSDETRVALLRCLGVEASSEAACRDELRRRDDAERLSPIVAVSVVPEHSASLMLRHAEPWQGARYRLSIDCEGARTPATLEGRIDGAQTPLPLPVAAGYHQLRLEVSTRDMPFEQTLIAVPASGISPVELLGGQRGVGVTAQLYSLVSGRNQGIGDLTDLATLARWAGERGAAFVGVNPLHALHNRDGDISPYSPVSRIFKNPIYLDVTAVPELDGCDEARALLASADVQRELLRLRGTSHVDYAAVRALKWPILRALHRTFVRDVDTGARGRAYRRYRDEEGQPLTDFATFMALHDAAHWREWAPALRRPDSDAVVAFREHHAEDIDFHCFLQFELDQQLARAASVGSDAGLGIGLYQDLAIGSARNGSDTWAFPGLFVDGAAIGAPPDGYSADGQNWSLPPLDPHALVHDRYRFFIRVVRAALRHAGALRIDHAIGLFRQFWIPDGMSGRQGAFVRYPADDLLGILALESQRQRAIMVGEDLGTVSRQVPPALHARGILSSRVLYFERDAEGHFHDAEHYEPQALTTANTHDMPTLAGYWQGRDIELQREVGMIDSDAEAARRRAERAVDRDELVARLTAAGVLAKTAAPVTADAVRAAVHEFLPRTPAQLVGLSLDDLVGEVEPVNLPGVAPERFASWSRKLRGSLDALPDVGFDAPMRATTVED